MLSSEELRSMVEWRGVWRRYKRPLYFWVYNGKAIKFSRVKRPHVCPNPKIRPMWRVYEEYETGKEIIFTREMLLPSAPLCRISNKKLVALMAEIGKALDVDVAAIGRKQSAEEYKARPVRLSDDEFLEARKVSVGTGQDETDGWDG